MAAGSSVHHDPERAARRRIASADREDATLAARVLQRVGSHVADELNGQKDKVTDTLDEVAKTVRRVGEPFREEPYRAVGEYVETAAGRIQGFAAQLRARDVTDLAADLGEFARRRPAAFVGAGLAVGLVAARLLKGSSVESRPAASRRDRSEAAHAGGPYHRDANAAPGPSRAPGEVPRKRSM